MSFQPLKTSLAQGWLAPGLNFKARSLGTPGDKGAELAGFTVRFRVNPCVIYLDSFPGARLSPKQPEWWHHVALADYLEALNYHGRLKVPAYVLSALRWPVFNPEMHPYQLETHLCSSTPPE